MADNTFTEGVKQGGITTSTQLRILLCYMLSNLKIPITRAQLEEILIGKELANYFVLAESLPQLVEQGLMTKNKQGYSITEAGRTVGQTLADELPRTIRETALHGVIQAQQYAALAAAHQSEILETEAGRLVSCNIKDETGPIFRMELYMPDDLSALEVKRKFIEQGTEVYKLVLAALTNNQQLAQEAINKLR